MVRDRYIFTGCESEIEKAVAIDLRTIEAIDANRPVQGHRRERSNPGIHQFEMKTTIIFNFHAPNTAVRPAGVQAGTLRSINDLAGLDYFEDFLRISNIPDRVFIEQQDIGDPALLQCP
jgi:hypothetical protein